MNHTNDSCSVCEVPFNPLCACETKEQCETLSADVMRKISSANFGKVYHILLHCKENANKGMTVAYYDMEDYEVPHFKILIDRLQKLGYVADRKENNKLFIRWGKEPTKSIMDLDKIARSIVNLELENVSVETTLAEHNT